MLAEAHARILLHLFTEDQEILAAGLASALRVLLQQQIALRAFYPQVDAAYETIKSGRLPEPPPLDAAEKINRIVESHTPDKFDPSVKEALEGASLPPPEIRPPSPDDRIAPDPYKTRPPNYPQGDADDLKVQRITWLGTLNWLYKAVKDGEKINKGIGGWVEIYSKMQPYMDKIIAYLKG